MEAYYKYLNTISLLLTLPSLGVIVIFIQAKIYFSQFWGVSGLAEWVLTAGSSRYNLTWQEPRGHLLESLIRALLFMKPGWKHLGPTSGVRLQEYEFWENI